MVKGAPYTPNPLPPFTGGPGLSDPLPPFVKITQTTQTNTIAVNDLEASSHFSMKFSYRDENTRDRVTAMKLPQRNYCDEITSDKITAKKVPKRFYRTSQFLT